MSAYVIRGKMSTGKVLFWVCQDAALWDWLLEDVYEASNLPGGVRDRMRIVRAPVGYVFQHGSVLLAADSEQTQALDGLSDKGHVTAKSPQVDKVLMSLHLLEKVTLEEFEALDLSEDRILDVELY